MFGGIYSFLFWSYYFCFAIYAKNLRDEIESSKI